MLESRDQGVPDVLLMRSGDVKRVVVAIFGDGADSGRRSCKCVVGLKAGWLVRGGRWRWRRRWKEDWKCKDHDKLEAKGGSGESERRGVASGCQRGERYSQG